MIDIIAAGYMLILVGIMIISGALGGIASALLGGRNGQPLLRVLLKHTFIGIAVAMMVPLVLNLLSSDLLEAGQTRPLKLFTLSGLCVFFALFFTRFLEEIFSGRSKDEGRYHQPVTGNRELIINKEEDAVAAISPQGTEKAKTSGNQIKILQALAGAEEAKLPLEDLLRHTAMPQNDFDESLSLLMVKGAVAQELIEGKELRLVLTKRGRQQLHKSAVN